MKRIFIVPLLIALSAATLRAQSADSSYAETLFSGFTSHGGYGGLDVKFSPIAGKFGVLVGGYGGWFINKTLMLGGGGYGLANPIQIQTGASSKQLQFGYGGGIIEYIHQSDKLLHYGGRLLIGAGSAHYGFGIQNAFETQNANAFFVLEPAFFAELNLTRFARLSFGVSYRSVSGVALEGLSNGDFSGVSTLLALKFGKF